MAPRRVTIGSTDSTFHHHFSGGGGRGGDEAATGDDVSRASAKFDGPGFRRFLLVVVVGALAFLPLATAAIAVFVDPDDVTGWLEPRLSAALNRDVTVGDAGIAFLPRPGLRLTDVRVGGGASDLPSVMAVRDVHLEAAILPLFTGRVSVHRLRLSGVDVHLEVDPSGVSNFGDLVPESRVVETAHVGPVGFAVDEVSLDGGSFSYFDGLRDRSFAVSGASATVDLGLRPDGGWSAVVDAGADSLLVRMPGLADEIVRTEAPSFAATLSGDAGLDRIDVEGGALRHRGQELTVVGEVGGIARSDPRLELRLTNPALQLGVLTAFLPQATRVRSQPALQGTADVRLGLRGGLKGPDGPRLFGVVGLSGAGLLLAGESWVAEVDGDLRLRADELVLDSVTGYFADGPFTLSATLDRGSRRVSGTVTASPDVDDFERLGLTPYGFRLAGGAELALDFDGPLSAADSLRLDGDVLLTGVQAEHDGIGVPLYVPSANLRLDGSRTSWEGLAVMVGTEPLTTSGSAEGIVAGWSGGEPPVVDATVTGARLDLDAVLEPEGTRPDLTYARAAFAHLGGRPLDPSAPDDAPPAMELERPRSLPVHGVVELALDSLQYRMYRVGGVRAVVALSDSALSVRDVELEAWGGTLSGGLTLGVGGRVDEPFALELRAEEVAASSFLRHMTPVGESVSGTMDLSLDLEGTTDRALMPVLASLDGTVEMTVAEGRVEGTGVNLALADFLADERWRTFSFTEWRTRMALEEEMLHVVGSELSGTDATVTLSGAVGLGGAVDLAMALSIPPERLEAISLRRTGVAQSVLDGLTESGRALDLGIRISGTLQGPTLEPDALAASEQTVLQGR